MLPIGVLVFLGAFIPMVGASVAGTVAVLVALVAPGTVHRAADARRRGAGPADRGPRPAAVPDGPLRLAAPARRDRRDRLRRAGGRHRGRAGRRTAGGVGNAVVQHLASFTEVGEDAEEALDERPRGTGGDPTARNARSRTSQTRTTVADIPTVTLADIEAVARGAGRGRRSPRRWRSRGGSPAIVGGPVLLKCENLQRTGSFKIRGAYVRLSRLTRRGAGRGVVAASRRQPRPGRGAGRPDARHQGHRVHARGRADPEGEGHPGVRRRGALRRAATSTRRSWPPRSSPTRPARC